MVGFVHVHNLSELIRFMLLRKPECLATSHEVAGSIPGTFTLEIPLSASGTTWSL